MVSITEEQASGAPGCENWHRDFLRCLSRKRYSNMVRVATEAASGDASSKFAAPKSGFFMSIWCRFLGGNTWITCCSGRRQTSKTSCSISGPTSTTIALHWKGKRRIRPRHDHQPFSARFDGNLSVEPSIRPRWLPDLSKTRARCGISPPRQYFQRNHLVFSIAARFAGSHRSHQPDTARSPVRSVAVTIRQ